MNVVAILQARMHSTRLPGKMLLPLLDQPLVRHVIERVRRATTLTFVVLAYPLLDNDEFRRVLKTFTDTPGVALGSWAGQGDENDLLERFRGAAVAYSADVIVRVPCDNPCVDPAYIDAAVKEYLSTPQLYLSNTTDWVGGVPVDGVGCEVFSVSRLKWMAEKYVGHPDWLEHPHRYWEEKGYLALPEARVTLDVNTQTEYEFMQRLYQHFGHNRFTSADVIGWLLPQGDPYVYCEPRQPSGTS